MRKMLHQSCLATNQVWRKFRLFAERFRLHPTGFQGLIITYIARSIPLTTERPLLRTLLPTQDKISLKKNAFLAHLSMYTFSHIDS